MCVSRAVVNRNIHGEDISVMGGTFDLKKELTYNTGPYYVEEISDVVHGMLGWIVIRSIAVAESYLGNNLNEIYAICGLSMKE